MLTPKKLMQIFRRWQQAVALRRRRIMSVDSGTGLTQTVASRGHVFVYTSDHKRFMVPLKYLSSPIFQELLRMSEDEYGLPSDGPIVLPCDATGMRFVISLIQKRLPAEVDTKSVLASITGSGCIVSSTHQAQQLMLYSF
jgi:Auxin responsive protein